MDLPNAATINVYLDDPAATEVHGFADCAAGPFVVLNLRQATDLRVRDVAVLDSVIVQATTASDALAMMLTVSSNSPAVLVAP